MNPNVKAAMDRLRISDPRQTAGGSKPAMLSVTIVMAAPVNSEGSDTIQIEPGKFFEVDQLNRASFVTATLVPTYDDASPTSANNTGSPSSAIDVQISTNSNQYTDDWTPVTNLAGSAGRPAWFAFKPGVGAGETINVKGRNRTGVACTLILTFVGSLHAIGG